MEIAAPARLTIDLDTGSAAAQPGIDRARLRERHGG
jgi:hypothetical protein